MSYGLRDIDGQRVELCDECGFDGRHVVDVAASLDAGYAALTDLVARPGCDIRPAEETWSGLEYSDHIVEVTDGIIGGCREVLGLPANAPVVDLPRAREVAVALASGLESQEGAVGVDLWPFDATVLDACIHLLHDLEHHILDVRRGLAAIGLASGEEVVTTRR